MFNLYYKNCQNNLTISPQYFNKFLKNMKVSLYISKTLAIEFKFFICLVMEAIFNSVILVCSGALKQNGG